MLNNANLIIDGGADSIAVFRFAETNFQTSNGNILVGQGGIGLNNIVFFTDQSENNIYATINQLHRSPPLNGGTDGSTGRFKVVRFDALTPGQSGR